MDSSSAITTAGDFVLVVYFSGITPDYYARYRKRSSTREILGIIGVACFYTILTPFLPPNQQCWNSGYVTGLDKYGQNKTLCMPIIIEFSFAVYSINTFEVF